jgi:ligand-binding SRPBCC domain-containing protein
VSLHRLERKQVLPISLEQAWEFFSNPQNLKKLTPPALDLVARDPVESNIYSGMILSYRIRPVLNIPVLWVTEITCVQQPYLFVDEQRHGPYKLWHHEHHFKEVPQGVEVRDLVHYMLPLGPFGELVHLMFVANSLKQIFAYRESILAKYVSSIGASLATTGINQK